MNRIDNLLYRINDAWILCDAPFSGWVKDAIFWYIGTDRASMAFITALERANPNNLLGRLGMEGSSTEVYIRKIKRYLQRWCGYREEG